MNRNSNGILVANNLSKRARVSKAVNKREKAIQRGTTPVTELMRIGTDETNYAIMYVLTTCQKEVAHYLRRKYTLVEQQPKTEAASEWLEHPDYVDEADLCKFYEKSKAFSVGGKMYNYIGCCHVDEQHVHRYSSHDVSLLVFVLYGKVTEIKYF